MLFFILSALFYYYFFVSEWNLHPDSIFQFATNQHDHNIYLLNMHLVEKDSDMVEFSNDKGIAIIYLFLSKILPFLILPNMELISLVFNCFILILNYWIYGKLADKLGLGLFGRLSFFLNLSLLYFAQLINKDMLTIFVILVSVYAGTLRRHWLLLFLIPFAIFIRIQLVIYILIFVFLIAAKKVGLRFFIVYIFTSLLATFLWINFPIIGKDALDDGFSSYLIDLNSKYLIGYLIFNPVRILQYIYDVYLSFNIFSENGAIDVSKVLRIPQLTLLAMLTIYFLKLIKHWNIYSKTDAKPLVISILAYACTWLMNPTVNSRYVMLITPILVLLGLYVRTTRQRRAQSYV